MPALSTYIILARILQEQIRKINYVLPIDDMDSSVTWYADSVALTLRSDNGTYLLVNIGIDRITAFIGDKDANEDKIDLDTFLRVAKELLLVDKLRMELKNALEKLEQKNNLICNLNNRIYELTGEFEHDYD